MRSADSIVRGALVVVCALSVAAGARAGGGEKVPITTSSEEARASFLKGRDLAERLRATDARRYYAEAAEKDPAFMMAQIGLAQTSGTTKEFAEAVARAVALAPKASDGERHIALALQAGFESRPAVALDHFRQLVAAYPDDERAQTLLGNLYFGRQEYAHAIDCYVKATAINPAFSQPYNQLGYAYRALERYGDAEDAFRKYVQLIPDDPNPYDSYGELLMKVGRFDESIAMYKKALAIDGNFVASYIGIGNDQIFKNDAAAARATFATIGARARNTGEKRLAHFWTAAAWVHEGATDKAVAEIEAGTRLATAEHDGGTESGDLLQIGDILREAGRVDEALAAYAKSVAVSDAAALPEATKAAARRNLVFEQGRAAVAAGDLATARARAADYASQVAASQVPGELRQQHELEGRIALAEKRYADAAKALALANQTDPCVLYLTAQALHGAGDATAAAAMASKAANFNALNINYGYVRAKARQLTAGGQ